MNIADPRKVEQLTAAIGPILAGNSPEVQGGTLGDLVAMFIAGHHPALREEVLTMHIDLVRQLIPVNVALMKDQGRLPPEWQQ